MRSAVRERRSKLTGGRLDCKQMQDRRDVSMAPATTQVVEYGNNLSGWTPVIIPALSEGIPEITSGSSSDKVKVTILANKTQAFIRLKVSK
jgi:hypothetical protein